jgi:hypothetical protein
VIGRKIGITIEDVCQAKERVTCPTSKHIQNQSIPFDSNERNDA